MWVQVTETLGLFVTVAYLACPDGTRRGKIGRQNPVSSLQLEPKSL